MRLLLSKSGSKVRFGFRCFCNQVQDVKACQSSNLRPSSDYALQVIGETMKVYDDFISEEEESLLLKELEPQLKRLRYEESHWDDVSLYFFVFTVIF